MKDIKFSVIIPVYNAEKYLNECILSVLNQTHKNFEIILVDDGSTDNSPLKCDEYSKNYQNIKVIHKKNGGEISARIAGNEQISGDYVLYIDADDMLRNDTLKYFAQKIRDFNCDIFLFEASKDKSFSKKCVNIPLQTEKMYFGADMYDIYNLLLTSTKLNSVCMKIIKRDLIENSFAGFESYFSVRNGADAMMSFALIDNAKSIMYTDSPFYFYRTNEESITRNYSESYYDSIKTVGINRRNYSFKWYNKIMPYVYEYNIYACSSAINHELTNKTYSYIYHYKKIKSILNDEFFISSFKNSSLIFLTKREKLVLKLIKNLSIVSILIMWLYMIYNKL